MLYVVKVPVYQSVLVDAESHQDAATRVTREGEGWPLAGPMERIDRPDMTHVYLSPTQVAPPEHPVEIPPFLQRKGT